MEDTCVCCGAVIPEGTQVCRLCSKKIAETKPAIAPCPFCGNTKLKVESKHNGKWSNTGTHSATVRCSKCHARGPTASCKVSESRWSANEATEQRAIELWNERVE